MRAQSRGQGLLFALERYDHDCSQSHLVVRGGHYCAELVTIVQRLLEKRGEWEVRASMLQVDFARAYDACRRAAILRAMKKRNVPEP